MGNPCGVKGLKYAKSTQAQEWDAHCNIVFVLSSLFLFCRLETLSVMSQTSNSSLEPLSQETFNDLFNTIGQIINPQDLQG